MGTEKVENGCLDELLAALAPSGGLSELQSLMRMASVLVSLDEDHGLMQCCAAASHALQVPIDQLRKELSACRKAAGLLQGERLAARLLALQAGYAVVRAGGVPGSPSTAALQQRICEVTGLDEHIVNPIMVALCLPTGDDAAIAIAQRLRLAIDQNRERATLEMQIDDHLAADSIPNPDFERLKHSVNRLIEYASRAVFDVHCWAGPYSTIDQTGDKALIQLRHITIMDARAVRTLKAKLDRVQATGHPFFGSMKAFYESYLGLADKMEALKGKVIPVSKVRAGRKQQAREAADLRSLNAQPLVRELMVHLEQYVARAEAVAHEQMDNWLDLLARNEWDMDRAAPMLAKTDPNYKIRQHLRASLQAITEAPNHRALHLRGPSEAKSATYVQSAQDQARLAFNEWIDKMTVKIGAPVVKARMSGDPWVSSFLQVTTNQGEQQTWHCQMILNCSKYGLLFNQFPARMLAQSLGPDTPAHPQQAQRRTR